MKNFFLKIAVFSFAALVSINVFAGWPTFSNIQGSSPQISDLLNGYQEDSFAFHLDTNSGLYGFIQQAAGNSIIPALLVPSPSEENATSNNYTFLLNGNNIGQITVTYVVEPKPTISNTEIAIDSGLNLLVVSKETACIEGGKGISQICTALGLDKEAKSWDRRINHWKKKKKNK